VSIPKTALTTNRREPQFPEAIRFHQRKEETMKALIYAAAASLALAAPAMAQSDATNFAIMHFNMDEDSNMNIRMIPSGDAQIVDITDDQTLLDIYRLFNMDVDSMSDLRGQGDGVTVIMTDPTRAQEIFARLRAESAEDE